MVRDLQGFQADCVDAFMLEVSKEDIKTDLYAKKLAKYINRQGKRIDKILKKQRKLMGF